MPAFEQQSLRLDSRKRADQVRERIVELLRSGDFSAGDRLPTEQQLMAMFGVGRSSVRAAIQSLVGLGIIELRPGIGTFVRPLSIEDVLGLVQGAVRLDYSVALNVHEVRAMIETTAARLAAERRTEADLEEMRRQIARYDLELEAGSHEGSIEADMRFHQAVVAAAKNPVLSSLLDSISEVLREHRRRYGPPNDRADLQMVTPEHLAIYDAIEAGNVEESVFRVGRHMRIIWNQIEGIATRRNDGAPGAPYLWAEGDEGL
jgi:GntR family transcriptional repressor for pyruvate dehydrogenase complex